MVCVFLWFFISVIEFLAERLRDEIREHPLRVGEIRRIVGLGRWHITPASTDIRAHGLTNLFTLTIDDTAYVVAVPVEVEGDRTRGKRGLEIMQIVGRGLGGG